MSETEKVPLVFFFSLMRVFPIKHLFFVSRAFIKNELKTPERDDDDDDDDDDNE